MVDESSSRICPRCGKAIPAGSVDCPQCDHRLELFLRSRETVLIACLLIVVVLFLVTGAVTRAYHEKLHALAGQWFAAAQKELNSGNAAEALVDLRDALAYEPEDPRIQFRLAQALTADGRDEEARSYLEGLLARSPSDAEVNLALARIASKGGNETDVLRYYHGAIYGVWQSNPEANRLNTRLELCKFLVARNDDASADGELIALESEIPQKNGAALHEQTAELFLRAGDASRALNEFRLALRGPHAPATAWKGAGIAAYRLGYFEVAERYLGRAERIDKHDAEVTDALGISRLAQAWDPYSPGLTETQRHDRTRHDFAQAMQRLQSCAKSSGVQLAAQATNLTAMLPPSGHADGPGPSPAQPGRGERTDLATLYAQGQSLQAQLVERNLRGHPEEIDAAMQWVFSTETATAQKCGEPSGLDKALLELQKFRQGGER
jgi:tetratricopeptide (TPR) repeat protein